VKSLRLILAAISLLVLCAFLWTGPVAALEKTRTLFEGEYHWVTPPKWYGTIVMKKNIREGDAVAPVVFEHWVHRRYYTCNVCHEDLGFAWKAGGTRVTQADIEAGKKCGACHNGEDVFGAEKCLRCHSYGKKGPENSRFEYAMKDMPLDDFGNRIDWVKALHEKKIKPVASLDGSKRLKPLDSDIVIPSSRFAPAPPNVLFPHRSHTEVLDCKSCHPGIFKPKKGANIGMDMMKIINGQYCGVCHGKVAFPLENCYRCHSEKQKVPDWITGKEKKIEEKAPKKKKKKKKKKKVRRFLF